MKTTIAKAITVMSIVAGLAAGTAVAAQASPMSTNATEHPDSGPFFLLRHGDNADIPTWVIGQTTICVRDNGATAGEADLSGAASARKILFLSPGEIICIGWWGWGTPVHVINGGYSPLEAWSV